MTRRASTGFAVVVALACGGCGDDGPTTGTIRGRCRLDRAVERPIVRVGPGMRGCADDHPSDRIDVDEGRALAGCLVALEPPPARGTWPHGMAGESRVHWIEVRRTRYVPHVSWVRVGTQVAFRNLDDCENNLHGWRGTRATTQFNFFLDRRAIVERHEQAFLDVPGTILLGNDGALWMDGTIHVVDHPWHDLTSSEARREREAGAYAFEGVPPGTYTVVCRHEGLGGRDDPEVRLEARLTVRAGETVNLDFEIPVPPPR
jgi:hypothetical protein